MASDVENKALPVISPEEPLWSDKKRPFFGLPLSFTRYILYSDRLIIRKGFFISRQEEVRLYRVTDHTLRQSIFQRFFGIGSIIVFSADSSTPRYRLECIRQPYEVAHLLSERAECERRLIGVGFFESLHTH